MICFGHIWSDLEYTCAVGLDLLLSDGLSWEEHEQVAATPPAWALEWECEANHKPLVAFGSRGMRETWTRPETNLKPGALGLVPGTWSPTKPSCQVTPANSPMYLKINDYILTYWVLLLSIVVTIADEHIILYYISFSMFWEFGLQAYFKWEDFCFPFFFSVGITTYLVNLEIYSEPSLDSSGPVLGNIGNSHI